MGSCRTIWRVIFRGKETDWTFLCLGYIFYEADEDFPPSVTCLYSSNANRFMPMDGLADVGEYTSKKILELVG